MLELGAPLAVAHCVVEWAAVRDISKARRAGPIDLAPLVSEAFHREGQGIQRRLNLRSCELAAKGRSKIRSCSRGVIFCCFRHISHIKKNNDLHPKYFEKEHSGVTS